MCRQSIDDRRGSKSHADRGGLEESDREAGASESEVRKESEGDETDGAAGRASTGHFELSDLRERTSDVAAL
jgi:hypothetical protein